jgi:hypothetical protein
MPHEVAWLVWKASQSIGSIVEIGVWKGRTTKYLATEFPHRTVYAVDLPAGQSTYHETNVACCEEAIGLRNVSLHRVGNDFIIPYDTTFIYIDGDHTRAGVEADTRKAVFHFMVSTPPGGTIVWHDYHPNVDDIDPRCHSDFHELKAYLDKLPLDIQHVYGTRLAFCDF